MAIGRELGDRLGIASSLEGLAEVIAVLDGPLRAARIWGAAERLRAEVGAPLTPKDRPYYARRVATARETAADDAAFDRAWQDGRALSLEQGVEFAMQETADRNHEQGAAFRLAY